MKVPSAPIGVSAAVADDENLKEGVYEFLKFYYGEEAAMISYKGSIFPATSLRYLPQFRKHCMMVSSVCFREHISQQRLLIRLMQP